MLLVREVTDCLVLHTIRAELLNDAVVEGHAHRVLYAAADRNRETAGRLINPRRMIPEYACFERIQFMIDFTMTSQRGNEKLFFMNIGR